MAKKQHEDKNPPEFVKEAKKRLKKRRPEYKKKRVIVPSITAAILIILGITAAIHATFYQSTDDAFVEGRLVSVAPRVAAPVVNLLVDDNQNVKAGTLLVELDPKDFEVALNQANAKLEEAKAAFNMSTKKVDESASKVNNSFADISSADSRLDFAQKDFARYKDLYKDGIVSKQAYEKAKTALDVAKAD